jgi:D-alanyl-D-alanine carboxypeptidase (penicillin-binding protein 5/6)
MKGNDLAQRAAAALCVLLLWGGLLGSARAQSAPALSACCAVLMDGESGRILLEKEGEQEKPMASITKIMTALVAVERGDLQADVKILPEYLQTEGSSIYLKAGETVKLETLLYGLMLESGNDAALAIAGFCAGDTETFVSWMNEKAEQLGLSHTKFQNPSGLPDEDHYASAADMASITRAAMANESFAKIFSAKEMTLEGRSFRNHNKLLWQYEGAVGGKTGFTKAAGRTLVTCAKKGDRWLIAVTLDAPDDWNDHKNLFDYGFAAFSTQVLCTTEEKVAELAVQNGESNAISLFPKRNVSYPLQEGENVQSRVSLLPGCEQAPVARGETAGVLTYFLEEEPVAQVELLYHETIPMKNRSILERFLRLFG